MYVQAYVREGPDLTVAYRFTRSKGGPLTVDVTLLGRNGRLLGTKKVEMSSSSSSAARKAGAIVADYTLSSFFGRPKGRTE